MFNSLQPHELHHFGLLWPPLSPRVCANSGPLSQWCSLTMPSSVIPVSFCFQASPASGVFQWVSCLHQVANVLELQLQQWSFQRKYKVDLFRIDWFDLLDVQGTQASSPAPQFKNINSLVLSLLYGPTLLSVHDYWKKHSFDYTDLCLHSPQWFWSPGK